MFEIPVMSIKWGEKSLLNISLKEYFTVSVPLSCALTVNHLSYVLVFIIIRWYNKQTAVEINPRSVITHGSWTKVDLVFILFRTLRSLFIPATWGQYLIIKVLWRYICSTCQMFTLMGKMFNYITLGWNIS